jgi:hypothetical protein
MKSKIPWSIPTFAKSLEGEKPTKDFIPIESSTSKEACEEEHQKL